MPSTVKTPAEILTKLRQNLVDHFSDTELHDLCFDMGVDYEDLPGEGKSAKARELVAYMDRRGRIAELAQKGSELRPNVAWGDAHQLTQPSQPTQSPSLTRPVSQHDVFLSYSRKDTDVMRRLLQELRTQGLEVWVDETGLEPGTPAWETAVGDAIENARCVVVILSPDAKESIWVGRELSYAETHNVRIFPVLARGDERISIPIRLTSAQYVDVRQDYAAGVQRLVVAVRKHLSV